MVGWQGVLFTLPPDWSLTAFSLDREDGYLKVDSPGTMFVQVKWTEPKPRQRPKTLAGAIFQLIRRARRQADPDTGEPDLKGLLDAFLKETEKKSRKAKQAFDSRVKSEDLEVQGTRVSRNFSWSGGGVGQGKIWYCRTCKRVVIAQTVGQAKDNVAGVAAQLLSGFIDHSDDGWSVWALFDLVCAVPETFRIKAHKLMSGYLRLDFVRPGGERIVVERWGLANIARRKFALAEWFRNQTVADSHRAKPGDASVHGHAAARGSGFVRSPLAWMGALRDAALTMRPATRYGACVWECEDTNKLYAVQVWHNKRTENLLDEVVARCECH